MSLWWRFRPSVVVGWSSSLLPVRLGSVGGGEGSAGSVCKAVIWIGGFQKVSRCFWWWLDYAACDADLWFSRGMFYSETVEMWVLWIGPVVWKQTKKVCIWLTADWITLVLWFRPVSWKELVFWLKILLNCAWCELDLFTLQYNFIPKFQCNCTRDVLWCYTPPYIHTYHKMKLHSITAITANNKSLINAWEIHKKPPFD